MGELNLDKIEKTYPLVGNMNDNTKDIGMSAWKMLSRNDEIPYSPAYADSPDMEELLTTVCSK